MCTCQSTHVCMCFIIYQTKKTSIGLCKQIIKLQLVDWCTTYDMIKIKFIGLTDDCFMKIIVIFPCV